MFQNFHSTEGNWFNGIILALGARGPGFDSRISPPSFFAIFLVAKVLNALKHFVWLYFNFYEAIMHSSSVHFIDNLIDNLYRSSQLNKDEFRMKSKSSMKSSFDSYTMPFALADEDKQHRSGLRTIMTVPMDAGSSLQPIYLGMEMNKCWIDL